MGRILLTWTTTALICLGAGGAFAQAAPEIRVENGTIAGKLAGGVEHFFGIPYAQPPVGDMRWTPPRPAGDWNGVRDATSYGSACPQSAGLDSVRTEDEDCLFVNVQRPEGTTAQDKLPVLVYVHGGSWETGSGNNENLNAIVAEGRVIGVTMNYRLGLLGSLAHPALADGIDVGNYGMMDTVAALEWVKRNIAAFGGDPDAVTLGGESAGAGSACTLMAAPSGEGLFRQAILMSTVCLATPREEAIATGEKVAESLGCEGDDAAACLRNVAVSDLLHATQGISPPVKGTAFLPESGWDAMDAGELRAMPVLIGATRNEGRSFLANPADLTVPVYDRDAYEAYAREMFGEKADAVLAVYPWPEDPTTFTGTYLVAELLMADLVGMGPGGLSACKTSKFTELLAEKDKVWEYEFAPDDGPGWFEISGGYRWGTGHATDLAYIIPDRGNFATNGSGLSPALRQLSDTMVAFWGNFVRTGDPNGEGVPDWPVYMAGAGPVMQLREGDRSTAIPASALQAAHNCGFWKEIGYD